MIELVDTLPDVNVQPAEYKRLLGFPRERVLSGRSRELADWARAWYAKHGRPWVYARQAQSLQITNGSILVDGTPFTSPRLQKTLQEAGAHGAFLVAVSAGSEIEEAANQAWREERPDEYFFLEIFGSAIVEHLTMSVGARLCAWADGQREAVLPHYSPGYPEWDVSQQPRLVELIQRTHRQPLPGALEALDSGMLRPKKSLVAVFGVTRHVNRVRRLTDLVPCENCSYAPCQFRRAPYAPQRGHAELDPAAPAEEEAIEESPPPAPPPLDRHGNYSINRKALDRWAEERLTLVFGDDGTIDAHFRYDGTTCTSMGRALAFDYHVKLGPRIEGYPIREQRCGPAPGDEGHRYMCRYMTNAEHLMVAIEIEKPLLGQPLNDVLAWQRPAIAAGCYCEPASRKHKWGLVLETIHYALVQKEQAQLTQKAEQSR